MEENSKKMEENLNKKMDSTEENLNKKMDYTIEKNSKERKMCIRDRPDTLHILNTM